MFKTKRKVVYRGTNSCRQLVPAIILRGDFLKKFGFENGSVFLVKYQEGKIEIELAGREVEINGH